MKFFARLLNPRFQFFFFAVLALFVTGLVAFCSPEQFPIVRYKLSLGMLAAVMETDAAYIEDALGALSGWDGVLNVGLVSISYEDELENKGYISCPEHKPRKCGPACFGETPNPLD